MHKLALLLLPELSHLGLAAVTEPLFVANWLAQRPLFQWRAISMDGKPVRASSGALLPVSGDPASARDCAAVFVLASFEPLPAIRDRNLLRWLRRLARQGVELGGIENGSLALAAAGLLDDHAAAVHWDNLAGFQELFPRIRISSQPFSLSRNRLTCAGAAAILDMMLVWIERRADAHTAEEVARHLLLRGPGKPRHEYDADAALLARARELMQSHLDEPLSCEVLAQRLQLSLRQLERKFKQSLGRGVNAEYRQVRIERAHQYLQQTELTVGEVAALTGFSSVEYFSKVYRRVFATVPSTDRRQSTDAPVFRRHRH